MSRTKRIYNNPRIKAPRYNLDDGEPRICHGIPYTKRSWICMGHCPQCRNPEQNTKAIRRREKDELRIQLSREFLGEQELNERSGVG